MKLKQTLRGFYVADFKDFNNNDCSIQESSLATDDCIWLGCKEGRMHLDKKQAKKLIKLLERFVKTGFLRNED